MRSVRSEISSLVLTFAVPAVVFFAFPYPILGFRASPRSVTRNASVALLELTPEQEMRAVNRAKETLRAFSSNMRYRYADLFMSELPVDASEPILSPKDRTPFSPLARVVFEPVPYAPSASAPSPAVIPVEKGNPAEAGLIPRSELLKID